MYSAIDIDSFSDSIAQGPEIKVKSLVFPILTDIIYNFLFFFDAAINPLNKGCPEIGDDVNSG
tara:strand:+ start:663 stop:851 length:189 start_codon:yes stop_codon:yes gene_type:complete